MNGNNPLISFVNCWDAFGSYAADGGGFVDNLRMLTEQILDDHIKGETQRKDIRSTHRGETVKPTIGLFTTNPETVTCKWAMIDIDAPLKEDEIISAEKKAEMLKSAIVIHDILNEEYNIKGWIDWSGRKGYHVGFKIKETEAVWPFNLMTEVRNKASEKFGKRIGGENYPKQPTISSTGYGNWIKMPLGIHPKTGERCVLVNPRTGEDYSLEDSIKVLVDAPINDIPHIGIPVVAREYQNRKIVKPKTKTPITAGCFWNMIKNGAEPGERHYSMLIIVNQCYQNGYDETETMALLKEFNGNCKPPKEYSEVQREFDYQWDRCERGLGYYIGCGGTGIISQMLKSKCTCGGDVEKCDYVSGGKKLAIVEMDIESNKDSLPDSADFFNWGEDRDGNPKKLNFIPKRLADWLMNKTFIKTMGAHGVIYRYKEGVYKPDGEEWINNMTARILGEDTTTRRAAETSFYIKTQTYSEREDTPDNILNVKNGLIDIKTMDIGPHNPNMFLISQIPVEFKLGADCPKIKEFVSQIVNADDVPVVQEIFGFLLLPNYKIQKAVMFIGSGSNGKSTLIEIMRKFIGADNTASIALQDLTENDFARSRLYGKMANLFADVPDSALKNTGFFKMLTGGDQISADVKFKEGFDFCNKAKLIFSCNKLPDAKDETDAFFRRWVFLNFPNKFEGSTANPNLIQEVTSNEELSGLLNWAMEGLKRLLESRTFTNSKNTEEIREYYEHMSNPIAAFTSDCIEISKSDEYLTKNNLYKIYCSYCNQARLPATSINSFSSKLTQHLGSQLGEATRMVDDKRVKVWTNIKINPKFCNSCNSSHPPPTLSLYAGGHSTENKHKWEGGLHASPELPENKNDTNNTAIKDTVSQQPLSQQYSNTVYTQPRAPRSEIDNSLEELALKDAPTIENFVTNLRDVTTNLLQFLKAERSIEDLITFVSSKMQNGAVARPDLEELLAQMAKEGIIYAPTPATWMRV